MADGFGLATVLDAMHQGVVSCPPQTPLREVARIMAAQRVHCVVVEGDDDGWGIVSDLDLVAVLSGGSSGLVARDAAATAAVTLAPAVSLKRAAQLMAENETTHLIVAESLGGRPIGVISTLDIVAAFAAG